MSDSETFLDDILEGVALVEPQALPGEEDVDTSRKSAKGRHEKAPTRQPRADRLGGSPPPDPVAEPTSEAPDNATPTAGLPEAAPQDILGLPKGLRRSGAPSEPEPEVASANGIDRSPAHTTPGSPKFSWDQSSFASIAREIAASVDGEPRAPSKPQKIADSREDEKSHVFFGIRGRRASRINKVMIIEVIGLLIVLVVGLFAEYKYVGRGQTDASITTTATQAEPGLPAVKLPPVTVTSSPGALFQLSAAASAQSVAFAVSGSFTPTWTVDCSTLDKPSAIGFVLQSGTAKAAAVDVDMTAAGQKTGASTALPAGSYSLIVHAPGTCTWTMRGLPAR